MNYMLDLKLRFKVFLASNFRYPHTALETIFEERPKTQECTDMFICNNTTKDWRNTLKKVPTNGKLYIRKKVVPR